MTARQIRETNWGYASLPLTNLEVAEKGKLACIDTSTGLVVKGKASTTLLPIGWFHQDMTGDGVASVAIKLFRELKMAWWDNDSGTPAVGTDLGDECYVLDDETVTMESTGHSKAGRVFAVHGVHGVLVEAGAAVTGPTGGTSGVVSTRADRAALKAIAAANRFDGMLCMVLTDNSLWRFNGASTLTDDTADELAQEPDAGTGCWVRADKSFVMKIPVSFGMVDGDTIQTIPEGFALRLAALPYWEITASWTGGTSSAIGVASNKTGFTVAGAILGGASGDVAATLDAGVAAGTLGTGFDSLAELQSALFVEGDTLTYEEITSAFTAGSGFVCVPVAVALAPATP